MTNVGYSMPPVRDGVMASVYVGQAYGPKRALWVCSTLTALAANWAGLTPVPADAPTVTATGSGTWATEVAMAKRPVDMAKSRTAVAVQWPGRSLTPPASTPRSGGDVVTDTSKSAVGAVDASANWVVGGSSSQPTPGSHGRIGKNDPRRTASPVRDRRSLTWRGRVRRQCRDTGTVWCGASVRPGSTTSVVGFGCVVAAGWSPIATSPTSRCAPAAASRGPLGHSRKTRRSVLLSGVNRTSRSPVTSLPGRSTFTVSV